MFNFSDIKYTIHSIIFVANGRYFDGHGNLNNWWEKGFARNFDERAQCFIDQYSQYHVGNGHINGLLTLNENVNSQE
jgi:endothelin-converting enzyme